MSSTSREATLPKRPYARIIRAPEVNAWQSGFALLKDAEESAERLKNEARRAYSVEYARGYEDGHLAGSEAGAELLAATTAKVDEYLGSLQSQVVDLATDIVRRMLGEFEVGHLVAIAAVHAIADIRRARYVKIRVHPDAADEVRRELHELTTENPPAYTIQIEVDDQADPGTCTIVTEAAVIDASIEGQLQAIASALSSPRGSL